jgi:predicted nucleic acid-binding protein
MNILPDTSIWITFFNEPTLAVSKKLFILIEEDEIVICPPVYQEILQGTKDQKSFQILSDRLSGLSRLHADPYKAALGGAQLCSSLRQKGITIRKSHDCLIAWYAIKYNIPIWHQDKDFEMIASHGELKIYNL